MMPVMRAPLAAVFVLVSALSSGCDATGNVQGGEALIADPCAATQGGHTWTDLYTCYFGPTGKASCSGKSGCHGITNSSAAAISGFVCGASKDDCWFGMTHPIYVLLGVEPLTPCDAGAAAADGSCPMLPADASPDAAPICTCYPSPSTPDEAIVPTGGKVDPTTTFLWRALHVPSSPCTHALCNNMPCGDLGNNCPKGTGLYTFTPDDLARISAWINEGAQNN